MLYLRVGVCAGIDHNGQIFVVPDNCLSEQIKVDEVDIAVLVQIIFGNISLFDIRVFDVFTQQQGIRRVEDAIPIRPICARKR